ncbi:MAG: hypothetical protein R3314_10225, partial [Longimicrobiales bacterium]|nr:hypothetical protein [Longimicrobiales bacterium]
SRDRLFDATGFDVDASYRTYDLARDDRRFIMLQAGEVEASRAADLILVENWLRELERTLESP